MLAEIRAKTPFNGQRARLTVDGARPTKYIIGLQPIKTRAEYHPLINTVKSPINTANPNLPRPISSPKYEIGFNMHIVNN